MLISDTSIKRPVLATVISLLILLAGLTSLKNLPVREYPDVENPIVSITTVYTGASPNTIEDTITQPIEEALNGLRSVRTIKSISAFGQSTVNIEFETNRDIDDAANEVTNAVQAALRKIPEGAERPIVRKSSTNNDAIIWIGLQGDNYSPEELSDIADRVIKPQFQVLSGVGSVLIGAQRKYAMRIWLDPKKMAARNVDIKDIKKALQNNNLQLPAGQIKGNTRQFNILADGQIEDPRIYSGIVVKKPNGIPVYLKDVAKIELGSENYDSIAKFSAKQIVGVGIVKQSKANELDVGKKVKETLKKVKETLPEDLNVGLAYDRTVFIEKSLKEVAVSLLIAALLVVIVSLLFLRTISATIIISLSIPISIIGAFTGMYLLGFSVNVLTMLAMILAIGIVVDDAIVVLENIYRRQEIGEDVITAAIRGTREVGFPVIATTLCLIAVFVPLSMLTGSTGKLFKEFSIAVAISVSISSLVALTLIPALCSRYLKAEKDFKGIYKIIEDMLNATTKAYTKLANWSIKNKPIITLFLIGNLVLSGVFYFILPKTFVPTEDRGGFVTIIKAPQGSTLAYTNDALEKVEQIYLKNNLIKDFFSAVGLAIGGPPNPSNAIIFAHLKDWRNRSLKQQDIVAMLFPVISKIPNALIFPINPPSLGQNTFGKDVEFVIKGTSNLNELTQTSNTLIEKFRDIPGLVNVDSDLLLNNPQLDINFKRSRISDAGLSVKDVAETLQSLFSESKLNEFILRNKQYDVITSLIPKYKSNPKNIKDVYINTEEGKSIPLDNLVKVTPTIAPTQINHYDLQRSITITASLLPGFPLGTALKKVKETAKKELEPGFSTALAGVSREYSESSTSLYLTFFIALIFIFLTLAATFESFIHPLTILLSVPLALLGSLATLFVFGGSLNLYSQIGIILLIGLVTKNSILIVDYTNARRFAGMELSEAVLDACETRFRPIIMTAITMIFGTLPLVFASGAGAESRHALGLVIIGGITFSTIFTLFVIPVIYILMVRLAEKLNIETIQKNIQEAK